MGLFGEKLPNIPAFMVSGKDFGWSDVGPMFLLGSTREYPHAVADYDGQFFSDSEWVFSVESPMILSSI